MRQLYLPFTDDDLYGDQWEYLLLALPQQRLTERVMTVKEDFHAVYNHELAIRTWPHITLAWFKAKRSVEKALIEVLFKACCKHRQFSSELYNFAGFDPSTIYIRVQEHQPFLALADSLRAINKILWENSCSSAGFVDHPHLTVARRLPYQTYWKAVQEYSCKCFQDVFIVNELKLLRRRQENDKCQRVTTLWLSAN